MLSDHRRTSPEAVTQRPDTAATVLGRRHMKGREWSRCIRVWNQCIRVWSRCIRACCGPDNQQPWIHQRRMSYQAVAAAAAAVVVAVVRQRPQPAAAAVHRELSPELRTVDDVLASTMSSTTVLQTMTTTAVAVMVG